MPAGHIKGDMVDTRRQRYKTDKQGHERYKTDKQGHERYKPVKQECGRILVASKGASTIFEVCHKCTWFREVGNYCFALPRYGLGYSRPSTLLFNQLGVAIVALFVRFIACAALFVRFIALAPSVNHIPFYMPRGHFSHLFVCIISRSVYI